MPVTQREIYHLIRLISLSLSALCTLIYAVSADASFEKAMEIYSKGHFEEARIAFETMAAVGDSASLFNLAGGP